MSDQQNHAWAGLRAQANANRKAAEEYLRKYNELAAQTKKFQDERKGFGEQLNAKDQEIENLRNEIGRIDLSRSPEFQEKYEAPIFSVRDEITNTFVANGMTQRDAEELAGQVLSAGSDGFAEMVSQFLSTGTARKTFHQDLSIVAFCETHGRV
jgi:phenylalanyl-tRNA synthetase alpha subunit